MPLSGFTYTIALLRLDGNSSLTCFLFDCTMTCLRVRSEPYSFPIPGLLTVPKASRVQKKITAKRQKSHKCPSTDNWTKKTGSTYKMEHHSSLNKKVLSRVTT